MKILVISTDLPWPPVGVNRQRSYHLLRALAARHDVTMAGLVHAHSPQRPDLPARVVPVPWQNPPLYAAMESADPAASQRAFATLDHEIPEPWFVSYHDCAAMHTTVRALGAEGFDLAILEDTAAGRFLPDLPAELPKVMHFFDIHTRRLQHRDANPHETARVLRYEYQLLRRCAATIVSSDAEAEAARRFLGATHPAVVPHGVDLAYYAPAASAPEVGRLLFAGTLNYPPNVAAVRFFVNDVLPLVVAAEPAAELHVVGRDPTREVRAMAGPDVVVWGSVPDMRPHFAAAEVVVVPLREGDGTRFKVLEAAAAGKAVVTTPLAAAGLGFVDGHDLWLADTCAEFARATVTLLRDAARRAELGANARRAAAAFDWERIGVDYCRLAEQWARRTQ